MQRLVVLGGGTAGTIIANKLSRRLPSRDWSITVVDPLHPATTSSDDIEMTP